MQVIYHLLCTHEQVICMCNYLRTYDSIEMLHQVYVTVNPSVKYTTEENVSF